MLRFYLKHHNQENSFLKYKPQENKEYATSSKITFNNLERIRYPIFMEFYKHFLFFDFDTTRNIVKQNVPFEAIIRLRKQEICNDNIIFFLFQKSGSA